MSLWRDGENLFLDDADPRGLGLSRHGLPLHRRAEGARARVQRAHRADGQLVQAPEARARRRAARPGRRSGSRTATTTARRCSGSRRRAASRTARSTAPRNPYLAAAAVLAAGLDGIENELDAGEPNSENLYAIALRGARRRAGCETLPANLLDAIGELERDDVLRGRSAAAATRTTSTTTPRASATSGSATTSRSPPGRSTST